MLHSTPHPELHAPFEVLGYVGGYLFYKRARARAGDMLGETERWSVIAAGAAGALIGSRGLELLEEMPRVHVTLGQAVSPGGGKTVVGGLLGGWLGVEILKKVGGIRTRTGDLFAIPICVGIAIGRIGCYLAGLADDTFGKPSNLPWAVDFGDGIPRHPTQAYEMVFATLLALALHGRAQRPYARGELFRLFLFAYLGWRLLIDFLKPEPLAGGLSWIQWACLAGLAALLLGGLRARSDSREEIARI